jgi:hypothetical protein
MTMVECIELSAARADLIARVAARAADVGILLMPTVAITAPPIAAFAADENLGFCCRFRASQTTLVPRLLL